VGVDQHAAQVGAGIHAGVQLGPDPGAADRAGLHQVLGGVQRVAEAMLPYVRGRPVHMQRFPEGIGGEQIQQKQAPDHFPGFVRRAKVARRGGGSVTHAVIDNAETLAYLADQACVTPHAWLSRTDGLDDPDQLIFDLDPAGDDLDAVRAGATALRELLEELGLATYLKTTGSRGYHVIVPLDRRAGFDQARAFARDVAKLEGLRAGAA
jgi:bifunctional non-homologous end joining protein LigD